MKDKMRDNLLECINCSINSFIPEGHDAHAAYYSALGVIDFAIRYDYITDDEDSELRNRLYEGIGKHIK